MKNYILLSLNTNVDTTNWHYGKSMLELMGATDERLMPQFISHNGDRINNAFDNVDSCKDHWATIGQLRSNGSMVQWFNGSMVQCLSFQSSLRGNENMPLNIPEQLTILGDMGPS